MCRSSYESVPEQLRKCSGAVTSTEEFYHEYHFRPLKLISHLRALTLSTLENHPNHRAVAPPQLPPWWHLTCVLVASFNCYLYVIRPDMNSLWPSDVIWWYRFGSTFSQVMACCLMALPQPIIYKNLWHSPEGNFAGNAEDKSTWHEFKNYWFKITFASPRGQ